MCEDDWSHDSQGNHCHDDPSTNYYSVVILNGGDAGVRDRTSVDSCNSVTGNASGACGVRGPHDCICEMLMIIRSLRGLAPSSG